MNRQQVRDLLQQGRELDGILLDERGVVLARGKVKIEGATLTGLAFGNGVALQMQHRGQRYDAPLAHPVPVLKGQPVNVQFAKDERHG